MSKNTKFLALTAVGIALFVVLSLCLQVPVFENYFLCLGYVAVAVYCCSFGTLSGTLVGFFGVILYCLVIDGLRGLPGWALGNLAIAPALGLYFRLARPMKSRALRLLLAVPVIVAACALGILVIKSETESLLYLQPFAIRAGKNLSAFIADAAVLILSLPVCELLDRPARRLFPDLARP